MLDSSGSLCAEQRLDALDSDVRTDYLDSSDGALVAALLPPAGELYVCGTATPIACAAGPTDHGDPAPVVVSATATPGTFTVTTGARSTTVVLGAGFALGAACRQDNCCQGD